MKEIKYVNKLERETTTTRARDQRIASHYDLTEVLVEKSSVTCREHLWSMIVGPKLLEVGVSTGKNISVYPPEMEITAIDLTPGMLKRAKKRAHKSGLAIDLRIGDVQNLEFLDNIFDTVMATFVFCSVPNPVLGLKEVLRVTIPGGQALFIEHVRSETLLIGAMMDLVNPMVVRLIGPNINRRTTQNVQLSGLEIRENKNLGMGDIFKLIVAHKLVK